MNVNTVPLKTRLIIALTVIASFTVLTSSTAIFLFSEVKHEIHELTHRDIIGLQQVLKISKSLREVEITLESIRTDYQIRENNNNVITLRNSWLKLSEQIIVLKNNNENIALEISHYSQDIEHLVEQLPNLSKVLFDLMEARLTSAYIHKDVIAQQGLLHSQLSDEIRMVHSEHTKEAYNNNKKEHLDVMNKLIEFHDKSTELSSALLSAFDENNILKINHMGRQSLTLYNELSSESQSFSPHALRVTKSWLQQIRRLLVGDTSIFTIRRTENRLTNIIDTLLNQHVSLSKEIEKESNAIATRLHLGINQSSSSLSSKLIAFSKWLIFISITCLVLVILIVWLYLGRKIFRPMEKIKNAMIKISNGNTDVELPKAENNEVGDMVLALSKLKEHVSAVTNMAQYDGLTNLFNRREFDIALNKEIRRCKREETNISLLLCDIDFFKHYNDNYGHIAGDKCLISCSKEMKLHFNRVTDLCFRYGGEEFAIIMVGLEPLQTYEMAEKLRRKIETLRIAHDYSQCADIVTISVGMVHSTPKQLGSPQDLLVEADTQLYKAKGNGRNRVEWVSF
jgi:diguanylate cyclase (GGDEF)-like protein